MTASIEYIGTGKHADYIAQVYQKHCGMLHNADFEVCERSECAAARALEVQNSDAMTPATPDEGQRLREELARLQEVERKAIEQSEYIQSHGLTEFEVSGLRAQLAAAQAEAERYRKTLESVERYYKQAFNSNLSDAIWTEHYRPLLEIVKPVLYPDALTPPPQVAKEAERLERLHDKQPSQISGEFKEWYARSDKWLDGKTPRQVAWYAWLSSYNNQKDQATLTPPQDVAQEGAK